MNELHFLLKKKGSSETYCSPSGKVVQFDSERDAEYYRDEAEARTRIEWEVISVADYRARYYPTTAKEAPHE